MERNGSIGKLPKFTFIQEMLQFRRQIIVVAHICIKTDSGTDGVASLYLWCFQKPHINVRVVCGI